MKKLFNIFLLFLGFTLSFAQQYPVRLIPVVIPPYSLKLGDYATSTDNKLQLQVLMTDLMEPQHQTGIKFTLEAGLNAVPYAQSNDFVVGMQPFTLFPGSNVTLTNVDLRALFELQNLGGINANQYAQTLSDGVYQFCFQAYDFYTKNNLSQKTCATVFLVQYDPPMLNLPQNAEKVQAVSPYAGGSGIVFQWMPRQIAPNTKYIFTLKELWDLGQSPISGFLSSPPLWREEIYAPTLYYGLDKTQLIPGKRYAWQVQAKSGNPVVGANPTDDNGVYKNNGLSEIFYFDYVENCAVPTLLMAKNAGRGRVELSWNLAGQPSGLYNVQWRKRGSTSEWQTAQSYQPRYIITGLEDQTEYEYRIGSVCGNLQTFNNTNPITDGNSAGNAYAYSGIQFFTTDANSTNNNYQCGVMPAVDIANKNPLQSLLGANEVFTAGDFPVTVISAQGSNGIYSGTGYIVVPYLADTKVKVSFNNIKLNTDKKLIEGAIETTYDPNETAVSYASAGLGETFGDAGVKEVTIDFPIGGITYSATPPPGKITITGSDGGGGTGSTVDYPGGKDYTFTDSNGNIWTVDENGTVTQGGKVAEGGASNSTNTDGITGSGNNATVNQYTAKGIKIEWKENAGGQFAYDTAEKTKLPKDKYPSVKDSDNNTVYVPYKATVNKQTELFDAKVSITDPTLKDAKIIFKTLSVGKAIEATEINKTDTERTYQLELIGAFDYAEEEVIAVVVPKDSTAKQQVISSFRLVHLSPKDINVALVPTDAESKKELSNIETQTNVIYKKVGVNINFNRDDVFDIAPYLNGNTVIPTEKNTALSTYSSVQQAINKGYGNKNNDRYILFVTDRNSDKAGQLGYMRLNGQFGYVFKEGLNLNKTGAHELGHGIFKLEHPFENLGLGEKTTPLLMDYRTGKDDIVLSHLDWKQINDPAFKLYAFQSQSSGELDGGIVIMGNSPDGNPITFDIENSCNRFFVDGKLARFGSTEIKKIKKLYIDEKGNLSEVTDQNDNTYNLSRQVSLEENKPNEIKQVYSSNKLVCFECIDRDLQNGTMSENIKKETKTDDGKTVTVYNGIKNNSKYVIANFSTLEDCTSGKQVLVLSGNTYICKTLTEQDCQNATGSNSDASKMSVWNLTNIKDNAKLIALENKLKEIFQGNDNNLLTGEKHQIKMGALIYNENSASVEFINNELKVNGKAQDLSAYDKYLVLKYNENDDKIIVKNVWVNPTIAPLMQNAAKDISAAVDWQQKTFFEKVGSISYSISDGSFTALYDMLDLLSKGIEHLKLPQSVWNPQDPDYNKWYGKVYSWVNPQIAVQGLIFDSLTSKYPQMKQWDPVVVNWAFFCGLYDGLVGVVQSVPDLLKLAISPLSEKGRTNVSDAVRNFAELEIFDENADGTRTLVCKKDQYWCKGWNIVKEGISGQFETPAKGSHFIGEIAGPIIVACFGDEVALEGTLGSLGGEALAFLKWCDSFTDVFRYAGWGFKFVKKGTGKFFVEIAEQSKTVIRQLDNNLYKVKVIAQNATEEIEITVSRTQLEGLLQSAKDGSYYAINAGDNVKVKLPTPNGLSSSIDNVIANTSKNMFGEASEALRIALYKRFQAVGVVDRQLESVMNKLGKNLNNGEKLIALLEKVDKRKVYDLLNDIEKSNDLQDFVKAGKDFTKEWQILESYPSFRVQGTFVNKITTILSKGHISEVDFTTILSVNKGLGKRATDLANFLEDLDHFALYQDRDGFGSIISGLKANWFNGAGADGANWVIAVLRKEGITVFDPAKTNFEVVENILGETRRYDAIVGQRGSGTEKYFEFKSYNKVPPTDFAKQFINDLNNANITDLKQLEWLFDAAKNPADFINNMKNAIRNLDEDLIDQATVTKFGVQSKGDVKAKVLNSFDTVFKLK